jgi:hypothetical protein
VGIVREAIARPLEDYPQSSTVCCEPETEGGRMLFEVHVNFIVDAMDNVQTEIIALGALQAAKAHVNSQAAQVLDSGVKVTNLEE